jgi:predicted ester cyclase
LGQERKREIPDGGILTLQPMVARKAYGIPQFIEVVLSVGGSVAGGIAGNYIYDRLKHHKGEYVGIRINRRNVQFDKGRITRMINEEIRSKRQ